MESLGPILRCRVSRVISSLITLLMICCVPASNALAQTDKPGGGLVHNDKPQRSAVNSGARSESRHDTSRDQLPPDVKPQFDAALARFRKAKEASLALEEAFRSDPVMTYIRQVFDESNAAQLKRDSLQDSYNEFVKDLRARSKDDYRQFAMWQMLLSHLKAAEEARAVVANPPPYDLVTPVFQASIVGRPKDELNEIGGSEHFLDLLPEDHTSLTAEQAREIWIKWAARLGEAYGPAFEKLDQSLNIPQEVREYANSLLTASRGDACRLYLDKEYESKKDLVENEVALAYRQVNLLWPGWERVMKEGDGAPPSDDSGSSTIAVVTEVPSWPRVLFILMTVMLVGAGIVYRIVRLRCAS